MWSINTNLFQGLTSSRHPLFSQLLAIFVAVCFAVSLRVMSSSRSLAWQQPTILNPLELQYNSTYFDRKKFDVLALSLSLSLSLSVSLYLSLSPPLPLSLSFISLLLFPMLLTHLILHHHYLCECHFQHRSQAQSNVEERYGVLYLDCLSLLGYRPNQHSIQSTVRVFAAVKDDLTVGLQSYRVDRHIFLSLSVPFAKPCACAAVGMPLSLLLAVLGSKFNTCTSVRYRPVGGATLIIILPQKRGIKISASTSETAKEKPVVEPNPQLWTLDLTKMSSLSQRTSAAASRTDASPSGAANSSRPHLSVMDRMKDSSVADSDYASDMDTTEHRPDKP